MRPLVIATALISVLLAAASARAQDQTDEPSSGLHWRNRPSFQLGDLRLDVRMQFAHDWRRFNPEIDEDPDVWRMRRGGINGEFGEHIEFQIERDFFPAGNWRDVFIKWRTHREFELSGGRFKLPFGFEQNVSTSALDFATRTLASNLIAPGRDKGVMANGRFLARGLTYEVGVFDDDGDNGQLTEEQFIVRGEIEDIGPSFVGRITATPLRPVADTFEAFRVGIAYGGTHLPEGLNSFRGETVYGTAEFFAPVYVKGRRTRIGVEANYTPGPFGFTAEWMQAREQRQQQGLSGGDLSDLITTGWYSSATWLVTGEAKTDFDDPRAPLFEGGAGAIELAVRYERLGFASDDETGPASTNPRAEQILGNADRVWTFGVNWFANRWLRATVNAVREELDDATRTPRPGTSTFWSAIARLQVAF